jgi:hypothetical protein
VQSRRRIWCRIAKLCVHPPSFHVHSFLLLLLLLLPQEPLCSRSITRFRDSAKMKKDRETKKKKEEEEEEEEEEEVS